MWNPRCSRSHLIQKGNTCKELATEHNINMTALMAFNPGLDCSGSIHSTTGYICVQSFPDAVNDIITTSINANVSLLITGPVSSLNNSQAANHNADGSTPNVVAAIDEDGKKIMPGTCLRTYQVRNGDTCDSVASIAGLQRYDFLALNPISKLKMSCIVCTEIRN